MHSFNRYAQGMNDIIAPIFCVFIAGEFHMSYL